MGEEKLHESVLQEFHLHPTVELEVTQVCTRATPQLDAGTLCDTATQEQH